VQPKADAKEWRSHLESTKTFAENIKGILPESRFKLEKLSDNLAKVLDKISKREKNINTNMTDMVTILRVHIN